MVPDVLKKQVTFTSKVSRPMNLEGQTFVKISGITYPAM
jgi:hypothetical protein